MSDSFATPWPIARQAPLSMGFLRQEYMELLAISVNVLTLFGDTWMNHESDCYVDI